MLFSIIQCTHKIRLCACGVGPDITMSIDKQENTAVGKLQSLFLLLTKFGKYAKVTCPLP